MEFDHLVIATRDLDQAKERFLELSGVRPIDGGPHPGRGTRNALVSLGEGQYLEILAPDPEQDTPEALMASFPPDGHDDVARRATEVGLKPSPVVAASRTQPSGEPLEWDLMAVGGHGLAGLAPFFIDWKQSIHPSTNAPWVGALRAVTFRIPRTSALTYLLDPPAKGVEIVDGEPEIEVQFESPQGRITLRGNTPSGFRF
jgi:catechol 2,3-dioxygenase-like lactoylglutathione lyase family enzyme